MKSSLTSSRLRGSFRRKLLPFILIAVARLRLNGATSEILCYRCTWVHPVFVGELLLQKYRQDTCLPQNFNPEQDDTEYCTHGCTTLLTFDILGNQTLFASKLTKYYKGTLGNVALNFLQQTPKIKGLVPTVFYRGCLRNPSVAPFPFCEEHKTSEHGGQNAVQLKCTCFSHLCNGEPRKNTPKTAFPRFVPQ